MLVPLRTGVGRPGDGTCELLLDQPTGADGVIIQDINNFAMEDQKKIDVMAAINSNKPVESADTTSITPKLLPPHSPSPDDPPKFIFLCHENFPTSIWSHVECECTVKQLTALIKQDIQTTIIVGSIMVRYTKPTTLVSLNTSLLPLGRALIRPIQFLSQQDFPNLYTIHLNIPHGLSSASTTTIATLCEENPHLNCHLWNVIYRATEGHLDHFILSISKQCFHQFNQVKNFVNFKSCQLTAPLEFYDKSYFDESLNIADIPVSYHALLNEMYSKYVNHLLDGGSTFEHAQLSAVTAMYNFKQIMNQNSPSDVTAKQMLENIKPNQNCSEETKILNDEPVETIYEKYVIISKNNFPKSFLTCNDSIVRGFHYFLNCLPTKSAIGDIVWHLGWLKIYYGDVSALKTVETLIRLVADPRDPLRIIPNDEMSDFHLISFSLPTSEQNNQKILESLIGENNSIDFSSWAFVTRQIEGTLHKFTVCMNLQSFNSIKNNLFKLNYRSLSYRVNVLTGFVKKCPISQNSVNILPEYLNYLNHLLYLGTDYNVAETRAIKAMESHQSMILPKNINSSYLLQRPIFFNVLFTQNVFESLQLLDEISTQPIVSDHNKYVLLCNKDFPKSFLSNYYLNFLKKGLCFFLNQLPIKPAIGNIVFDAGWLKIYYRNHAALKILVKIVQMINDEATELKLILADQIPEFKCIAWSCFPSNGEKLENILENLKIRNRWLDMSGWSIAKREWDTLYITMGPQSFSALENNSFYLNYKSKAYLTKPQDYNFLTKSSLDVSSNCESPVLFNFEPIQLLVKVGNNEKLKELIKFPTAREENRKEKSQHQNPENTKKLRLSDEKESSLKVGVDKLETRPYKYSNLSSKDSRAYKEKSVSRIEKDRIRSSYKDERRSKEKYVSNWKHSSRESEKFRKISLSDGKKREKSRDTPRNSEEDGRSKSSRGVEDANSCVVEEYLKFLRDLDDLNSLMNKKISEQPLQHST